MAVWLILGGLVLLVAGAEALVRGASTIARAAGIPPLVVGLTVVAFGTSAPEVAVSVRAALAGQADLSWGNVVGSNLFNLLVILGLSAVCAPLLVGAQVLRRDVPMMIAMSVLVWGLAANGRLVAWEAWLLLVCLVSYTVWLIRAGRREGVAAAAAAHAGGVTLPPRGRLVVAVPMVIAGLCLLVVGAGWLVDRAVSVARDLGVSELVIGLTIVAGGTSLPELATSVVAALRGQRDIAIGNVVGSNTFNLLGVLGAAGVVAPGGMAVDAGVLAFDLPVAVGVAALCWPLCRSGATVSRREGLFLLLGYLLYTTTAVLISRHASGAGLARLLTWTWLGIGLFGSMALVWRRRA